MDYPDLSHQLAVLDPAVREMLGQDLPVQLSAVRKALLDDELGAARLEVHSIHGSAAFCRLEELRQAAATLERSLENKERNAADISAFENSALRILHLLEQD